jgi:hypothetical protein
LKSGKEIKGFRRMEEQEGRNSFNVKEREERRGEV